MEKQLNQLKEKYAIDWREFEIGNLFDKPKLKSIYPKNFNKDSDISKEKTSEFDLPLVNAKSGNNGIMYFGRSSDFESLELSIGVIGDGAVSTGDVNPQPQRTGVLYNAYLVKPKWDEVTRNHIFYFSSVMKKAIKSKFGYENKASWDKVKLESIKLPVKSDGQIAFDYIEEFINTLEAERLATLEAYLKATGLKDVELSEAEAESLQSLGKNGVGQIEWREFTISELFTISTPKKKFNANTLKFNGKYPYIARGEKNNGVRGYITEDEQYLNAGNTISFGQDTATMFYQPNSYFTGDKIKIFTSKYENDFNKMTAYFLISMMKKRFSEFSWGSSSYNVKVLEKVKVNLPFRDGDIPDFEFMTIVMKATQKIVIKNVVDWLDKRIETTRAVINR